MKPTKETERSTAHKCHNKTTNRRESQDPNLNILVQKQLLVATIFLDSYRILTQNMVKCCIKPCKRQQAVNMEHGIMHIHGWEEYAFHLKGQAEQFHSCILHSLQ